MSLPIPQKYLVCGGRDYTNHAFIFQTLDALPRPILVIECGQRQFDPALKRTIGGADFWAMRWANVRGIECVTEKAEWRRLGRAAGAARNALMLKKYSPTLVVAFPGGRGTANMVRLATEAGVKVIRPSDGLEYGKELKDGKSASGI